MHVDTAALNIGSFCSGVGWLDLAVHLACEYHGIRTRSVFMAEWESYAAAVLQSRMEDSSLEPCPVWAGDLREFPASEFRGVVDAAVFGFPCQDISTAGKGEGINGERSGLFFDILQACCDMGCRYLFMENVAAITSRGLDIVLGSLAEAGFDAEWLCLPASAVGASQRRDRWFCVAYRDRTGQCTGGGRLRDERHDAGWNGTSMAESPFGGQRVLWEPSGGDRQPDGSDETLDDTERSEPRPGEQGEQGQTPGQRRGGFADGSGDVGPDRPLFAPGPTDPRWPDILKRWPHLAPAIEPGFRCMVDGCPAILDQSRADQLRCSGNGVVVLQAAAAFAKLLERVG